ncbi:MAG: hypothetical protein AB7O31_05020 [Burkholderiales bacterium]
MSAQEQGTDSKPLRAPRAPARFPAGEIAASGLVIAMFGALLVGAGWWLAELHALVSLAALAALYLALCVLVLLAPLSIGGNRDLRHEWKSGGYAETAGLHAGMLVVFMLAYGALCGALHRVIPGMYHSAAAELGALDWLLWSADSVLQALSFHLLALVGVSLSPIYPEAWSSIALEIAFRLELEFYLVVVVFRLIRFGREEALRGNQR